MRGVIKLTSPLAAVYAEVEQTWVTLIIAMAVIVLIGLAIWGMASLESYYRNITLATMPLQMLLMAVNAVVFVFLYMSVFRGGFAKMDNKRKKRD